MNHVVAEMSAIMNGDPDALAHYGKGHKDGGHSGRYPWGSGEDGYQRSVDFLDRVEKMRREGATYTDPDTGKTYSGDTAIAKSMGLSSGEFRTHVGLAKDTRRMYRVSRAKDLKASGKNDSEIGRIMGVNESTVRSWLNANSEARMKQAMETANFIRSQVDSRGMIDVGVGTERELNISREKFDQALTILKAEGYPVYNGGIPQVTNKGQQTNQKVICPPGTEHKDIYNHDQVHSLNEYISRDDGATFEKKFHYPASMDSSRVMIRYKEDGGIEKDGVVELRRGVPDLSLGESRYSQVRILVDGTHYIKGMAVYGNDKDFPPGVDAIFNTNKDKSKSKMEVLKEIKPDRDNPFGSAIKDADKGGQYWYNDPKTGERKLGLINKRADEGDWSEWKDALPSQFLSKQSLSMAKKQLTLAKANKQDEFDSIMELTNPTIKKHLLEKFADSCDSAAVHLQAAALPGQKYHVIIPITSMKDNEVYAPNYENGSKLALIRYPHAGTFEIPILTVNNKQPTAKKLLGTDVTDAVGINSKVAERLSGADFDGDTVMCIPTHDAAGKVKIASRPYLQDLVGFDPKMEYPARPGMKYMKDPVTGKDSTQMEMGKISNLISDMTLIGAPDADMAKAVKHSMVVIDAGKHKLDYRQSEIDNDIDRLKREYQKKYYDENGRLHYGGAGTLISRSKGETTIEKRQGSYKINLKGSPDYDPSRPEGAKIWKTADDLYYPIRKSDKEKGTTTIRTVDGKKVTYDHTDPDARAKYTPIRRVDPDGTVHYTNKTGDIEYKLKARTQKSNKMSDTDDAMTLVSTARHPMELAYASYANSMKAMGNSARKELAITGNLKQDPQAKKVYAKEVEGLNAKLNEALKNATRERQALRLANAEVQAKTAADPTLKSGDIKKLSQQALAKGRIEAGSVTRKARNIDITDREWEAIQAGAVSESTLQKILNNTDIDKLRERATPKGKTELRESQKIRAKAMAASNYTLEEIAKKMGVSSSTVSKYLRGV